MKFVIAFFMAWGNFLTLPCPYKRWDNELKNMMLAFLPSIGAVVGGLWVLLYWVLGEISFGPVSVPPALQAIACVYFLFASCGFMHLDGFMDCNDAIMSRRPLEDRQRILKDSHVGAFAVVTVVFLMLTWYACMSSIGGSAPLTALFLIPVASRSTAGFAVMQYRPIGHSQYKEDYEKPKGKFRAAAILQLVVYAIIACAIAGPDAMMPLAETFVTAIIAGSVAGAYARKQLGGMSGDIAGYMICWGELAGIIALTLLI